MLTDPETFIRSETRLSELPGFAGIRLHLADEAHGLWSRTEAELQADGLPPPFWAFAWAGGLGLARHILDHPDIVKGRSVLDFAAGSGLVGIAAMRAGARAVRAVDIDPWSAAAIRLNAAANAVSVKAETADLLGEAVGEEVILAGDVFYDRAFSDRVTPWLSSLGRTGRIVLAGDPGRHYRPGPETATEIARHRVAVSLAVEDAAEKSVAILAFTGG